MAEEINFHDWQTTSTNTPFIPPRSRNRLVEMTLGIFIIILLQTILVTHSDVPVIKAKMTQAFSEKWAAEKPILEALAIEGELNSTHQESLLTLASLPNGKLAGLRFSISADPLYVVNWECRFATTQEITKALSTQPDRSSGKYMGHEPVSLPIEYSFSVCRARGTNA